MSREVVIPHSVRVTITFDLDYPRNVAPFEHSPDDVLCMVEDDIHRLAEETLPKSFLAAKCRCELGAEPLFDFTVSVVSI
jgi:hypothetical protein